MPKELSCGRDRDKKGALEVHGEEQEFTFELGKRVLDIHAGQISHFDQLICPRTDSCREIWNTYESPKLTSLFFRCGFDGTRKDSFRSDVCLFCTRGPYPKKHQLQRCQIIITNLRFLFLLLYLQPIDKWIICDSGGQTYPRPH